MEIPSINNSDYLSSILQKLDKKENQAAGVSGTKSIKINPAAKKETNTLELTDEEKAKIRALEKRDREVRAHESAHLQAAGKYATSGAIYSYDRGPDNKIYIVGGEVRLDAGEESTPEKTLEKMEVIKRAALAPADPSAQDRIVAARAAANALQASAQIVQTKVDLQIQNLDKSSNNKTDYSLQIKKSTSETYSMDYTTGNIINTKM